MEKLGVKVKLDTRVTDFDGSFVYTESGEKIQANKVIWAAGIRANSLKGIPESAHTYGNRLKVDRYNAIEGLSDVYALGDLAYMEEEAFPQGHPQVAQVAMQQAKNLAINIKAAEKGQKAKPFFYKDLGTMATIGRNLAVVDLARLKFQGAFAWLIWLAVHLYSLVGVKNKIFVFINWLWNYITYDQSLRLILKPDSKANLKEPEQEVASGTKD